MEFAWTCAVRVDQHFCISGALAWHRNGRPLLLQKVSRKLFVSPSVGRPGKAWTLYFYKYASLQSYSRVCFGHFLQEKSKSVYFVFIPQSKTERSLCVQNGFNNWSLLRTDEQMLHSWKRTLSLLETHLQCVNTMSWLSVACYSRITENTEIQGMLSEVVSESGTHLQTWKHIYTFSDDI